MTVVFIPREVCSIVECFIQHPDDHFNLKSTCSFWYSQLSPSFSFKDVRHIVSCNLRGGAKYRQVNLKKTIDIVDVHELSLKSSVPYRLVFAVCSSISDEELEILPTYGRIGIDLAKGFLREGRDVLSPLARAKMNLGHEGIPTIFSKALEYSCPEESCLKFLRRYPLREYSDDFRCELMEHAISLNYITFLHSLQQSAPIDLNRSYSGGFLLQHACRFGNVDSLLILLLLGACPRKVRYRFGRLPLVQGAAVRGDFEMLVLLKALGGCFNERNFYGTDVSAVLRDRIRHESNAEEKSKLISCLNFVSLVVSYLN